MKKIISTILSLFFVSSIAIATQNPNSHSPTNSSITTKAAKKRGPVFRATKNQINQAQKILKDHGLYAGGETGKLDVETRGSLKKYQSAESLKVTGTLNKVTLEKMGITLTDKQKVM